MSGGPWGAVCPPWGMCGWLHVVSEARDDVDLNTAQGTTPDEPRGSTIPLTYIIATTSLVLTTQQQQHPTHAQMQTQT